LKGFVDNIEKLTEENDLFRKVLYTIYGPPEHVAGTIHRTCAEANTAHEHFDGRTTE
jgi:hypothetical protein